MAAAGVALGVASIAVVFWTYGRDVHAIDHDAFRNYRPEQVTRVLARDGTLIGELFTQRRTVVPHDVIPAHVENAFLAAEDAEFYRHAGMDYAGMLRALVANVREGRIRQGASTITQQVVKNFLLTRERTFERKIQELVLARRLEEILTKREILELYLNDIYFGHGRYGVEEASRFYFGRSVTEIDLGQAALLASLPKAPSKGSPFRDAERAKARQVYVLEQMARHGYAGVEEVERAIVAPLALAEQEAGSGVVRGADEFVDVVREHLEAAYGKAELARLGATVTTTVDLEVQRAARQSLRDGLVAVDKRRGVVHRLQVATESERKKILGAKELDLHAGDSYQVLIERHAVSGDGLVARVGAHLLSVNVPAESRYRDAEKSLEEQFPVGATTWVQVAEETAAGASMSADSASIPVRRTAHLVPGPQASVVVLDVKSGEVLAMVGAYAYRRAEFNRALRAKRQPGSVFKPFIYGAALASRQFTAASIVSDSPEIYQKWRPTNFERDNYRGEISVREALTHSVNTVAIKLLDAVGPTRAIAFAHAAGIESELIEDLSLALGTSELTPIDLAKGYLTIARSGSKIAPIFILERRVPGDPDWRPDRTAERTMDPGVAFLLTSLMTSVVEEGTGRGARELGRPVAGKTGTSADYRDAWFAGFTADHVAVAWVGFDRPRRIGRKETGGRSALPIWLGAMMAAEVGHPPKDFLPPPQIEVRTIDRASGLLARVEDSGQRPVTDKTIRQELFLLGTAPTEFATPQALPTGDILLDLYADE